jgi:hypothetical protein
MINKIIVAIFSILIVFTGCGDKKPEVSKVVSKKQSLKGAPFWVNNPIDKNIPFRAVGKALKNPGGIVFQKVEALANARDKIESLIGVKTEIFITKLQDEIDVFEKKEIKKIAKRVAKQTSSQLLSGTKEKKMWINPFNENLYLLVELDKTIVKKTLKEEALSALRSNPKWWLKFQDDYEDNLEELEKCLKAK